MSATDSTSNLTQHPTIWQKSTLGLAITAALLAGSAHANTPSQATETRLPQMHVVGTSVDEAFIQPGAATLITFEEIQEAQPRSTEDVLRRVPGIYIKREEDSAIVTNLGVRGLPAGDYKTLVLEDGVPVQSGIFVGNSRYYNPRVQRMGGVELLKGASSLRHGPNNIGGVINYQTRVPEGVAITGRIGSWNTREAVIEAGGRSLSQDAYFGVIATRAESDGWMDKGWEMTDVMVRAGTQIGHNQFIGVKFTHYESDANISYRGLFPDAYTAGASYNPAPDDWLISSRIGFDLTHEWDINPQMQLRTLAYWNESARDYWRYQLVSGDPFTTNAQGHRIWNYSDTVQGNNRTFERLGLDTRFHLHHALFGIENETELGMRLMHEEMLDQTVRANRATPRNPNGALNRNREDSAQSLAVFAQNRFDLDDRLSITAALRIESYDQERHDLQKAEDATQSYSNTEVLPGLGVTYWLTPSAQLYGSVYQAFAPPVVGSVVGTNDQPTDAEKSLNIEIGLRGGDGSLSYEVTAFRMDFSNQVDPGISGIRNPNEGSALIQGIEAGVGYEISHGLRADANVTWIPTAEYGEDRQGEAEKGNRLAYSPEWTANVTLGYRADRLQTALLFNFTDSVYGDGMNRTELTSDSTGVWGGEISSYWTLDWTASMDVTEQLRIFGAVKNLTDEQYIGGLRQGIYAGPERSFELGLRYQFY